MINQNYEFGNNLFMLSGANKFGIDNIYENGQKLDEFICYADLILNLLASKDIFTFSPFFFFFMFSL